MKKASRSMVINRRAFYDGLRGGIPIGLGYLAVSFSLGIAAQNAGLSPFQGFLASILCNASAGEYAGFTQIAAHAAYLETALITFIVNARYMLMSCAMSQRISSDMPLRHRLLMSFYITDEIFGISIARPGMLNPYYTYGAAAVAAPGWGIGTLLGAVAGNILPLRIVSALSVALFGMFLAVIIPPSRKSRVIAGIVAVCFILSFVSAYVPFISGLSEGTRIIILTVVISSAAAILFPKTEEESNEV